MKYQLKGHITSARSERTRNHVQSLLNLAFTKSKERILSSARTLAGTNYGISQDFPREIVEIRKDLVKVMNEAKKEGKDRKLVTINCT